MPPLIFLPVGPARLRDPGGKPANGRCGDKTAVPLAMADTCRLPGRIQW